MKRCELATMLNQVCGCTTFNLYNIELVPQADVMELVAVLKMEADG